MESQSNDEPTRDRLINRNPTNADRSLQLFLLHILALCNVWQHLNTCASRIMQVYASHSIALNKWRLKILAHVSLNANCFIFTSGCLLLFTFNYTLLYSSKVLLYYFTVNSRDTVYALCQHVIYVSLQACYYQQKLVTLRWSVQGVY